MKRLLLIDAYAMIYRAYYAFLKHPRITSDGLNTSAVYGFVVTLDDLLRKVAPTHLAVAFDPPGGTFRHEAYPQYKAQRQQTPEDIRTAVPLIKDVLAAMKISVMEVSGYEADDVIGTLAVQAEAAGFEVLMATPDKDYGQLVSEHIFMYRPRHTGGFERLGLKEVCERYGVTSREGIIDLLALMGDSSDNIPGCAGVGEKTAQKLLQDFGTVENLLSHTDTLKGALRVKIESQTEQIRFSRFLATIKTDVPLVFDEVSLLRQEPDHTQLAAIYQALEFRSLFRKTQGGNAFVPEEDAGLQEMGSVSLPPLPVVREKGVPPKADCVGMAVIVSGQDTPKDLFSDMEEPSLTVFLTTDGTHVWSATPAVVRSLLEDDKVRKIGFDLKNDYKYLAEQGIALRGPLFDTAVAHYLTQPEQRHDIDILCETLLQASCGSDPESRVAAAFRLDGLFPASPLQQTEMELIPVLAEMEAAGVRFDTAVLREASRTLTEEMKGLEEEIQTLAGVSFNINSPRQVGEVLFDTLQLDPKARKTRKGQYETSEEVLQAIADRHPVVEKILDYRAVRKLLSTYIDNLPSLINPRTGKIHTTYNQTVTATGRLSSSNPNLQNLPIRSERGKEIRRAVIPDPECVFLSADYSQIELRLMAHFSGDEHLTEAFRSGQDIHTATAAKIFGLPLEQVTKDMRRRAKTANFGILYGISAFGLAQQLGSSRAEAKELIEGYFNSFPQVVLFIRNQQEKARRDGYVETLFGRRRYLPDINSRNATVRSFAERNAVNAPIQGTAADIIKLAMVRIHNRLKQEGLKARMIMQVHDELNFNVPITETEQVRRLVIEEMQNVVTLSVPLTADCGMGPNWLLAH